MSKPIDTVVAELLRETASWQAIEARITIEQDVHTPIGKTPPHRSTSREHYIETVRGQRYYHNVFEDHGVAETIWLAYSDGARSASVEHKGPPLQDQQQSIVITRAFMDEDRTGYISRPEPLRFQFVGIVPLHQAIRKAVPAGEAKIAGRACDVYRFPDVPGSNGTQILVYSLDALTSVPLKVEAFADQGRIDSSQPSWVWEATSCDEVQGFHVPLRSTYTGYIVSEKVDYSEQISNTYTIADLKFNQNYAASTFWPNYDKDVRINDLIAKKTYYNTHDRKPPPEQPVKQSVAQASPLRAAGPSDFTPWFAASGITLGCLIFAMALYLRFRR